jgi:hypothetical protein
MVNLNGDHTKRIPLNFVLWIMQPCKIKIVLRVVGSTLVLRISFRQKGFSSKTRKEKRKHKSLKFFIP